MNDRLRLLRAYIQRKTLSELKKAFSDAEITELMAYTEHSLFTFCVYMDCDEAIVAHLVSLSRPIPKGILEMLKTMSNYAKYSNVLNE